MGCSDFQKEWKDPSFNGRTFKNLVVVGISSDVAERTHYESQLVLNLRNRGIDAREGIDIFTQELTNQKEHADSITQLIIENEIDGVLMVKVVHAEDEYILPEDYSRFSKFYAGRKYHLYTPGYYSGNTRYILVATLYDLHEHPEETGETAIWSASQIILRPATNTKRKEEFIRDVAGHLVDQGLLL